MQPAGALIRSQENIMTVYNYTEEVPYLFFKFPGQSVTTPLGSLTANSVFSPCG